jgi:hypothetical protein
MFADVLDLANRTKRQVNRRDRLPPNGRQLTLVDPVTHRYGHAAATKVDGSTN